MILEVICEFVERKRDDKMVINFDHVKRFYLRNHDLPTRSGRGIVIQCDDDTEWVIYALVTDDEIAIRHAYDRIIESMASKTLCRLDNQYTILPLAPFNKE